jgi:hypothetical protein
MNILEMDLTPEDEKILREQMESWKEEAYAHLMEDVEKTKKEKIDELDIACEQYKQTLKEEFTDKMLTALNEMRGIIISEVTAEVIESNPELAAFEKVKELVAPTLNEEYISNTYANQIVTLQKRVEELEEEKALDEGAKTLAELITPYSEGTRNILINMVKPGNSEYVTEQFYDLIEALEKDAPPEDTKDSSTDSEEDPVDNSEVIDDIKNAMKTADEKTKAKLQKILDKLEPEADPEESDSAEETKDSKEKVEMPPMEEPKEEFNFEYTTYIKEDKKEKVVPINEHRETIKSTLKKIARAN